MANCYMCDKEEWLMREVKGIYQVHGLKDICESCGKPADKLINYWGKKKHVDLINLKSYLNDCAVVKNKYSALVNAGYY